MMMATHSSSTTRLRASALLVSILSLGAARLLAHDLWMEPTTFQPPPGEIVGVRLRVGQDLLGDPVRRSSALIDQFVVVDAEGRKPVVGRDGSDPAGFVRAAVPGVLIVGYHSKPSAVELTAEKFNQYLKEEGLDAVAALRARRNETGAVAHEIFIRCAKSLVLSGPAGDAAPTGDRTLGFPLELVAERNPYALRSGQELPVRLTYEKRALEGALVVAVNKQNPSEKQALRTDADGRVRFRLRPGGMWLIKAVHMHPAPAGSNAEWVSFWASLTFQPPASQTESH